MSETVAEHGAISPAANSAGVIVDNITVTYRNGHTALRDASFSVPRGTITAHGGRTISLTRAGYETFELAAEVVLRSGTARLAWAVSRLAPRLYARLMTARLKAELTGE